MKYKTIFLDRDGVINVDSPDYIKSEDEFNFIPESPEAVSLLSKEGCDLFIITNQSVINRGMISLSKLEAIFLKMLKGINKSGGKIKDIFFCQHTPDECCECRKPKPKMILDAAKKYNVNLNYSIMIGDSVKDIEAGKAAGCGATILVLTGNGKQSVDILKEKSIEPDFIANNLMDAAIWITKTDQQEINQQILIN